MRVRSALTVLGLNCVGKSHQVEVNKTMKWFVAFGREYVGR